MALARCCCWPDLPLASVAHSPAALPHGPRAGTALLPGAGGYAAAALASAHVQLRRLGAEQLGRLLLLTASGPHPDEARQHELQAMLVGALQVQTCGRPLKTFHAACTHECWPAVPLARVPSLPVAAGCAAQILHAWCYYCPWTERGPPYMPTHPPPAHLHPSYPPTHTQDVDTGVAANAADALVSHASSQPAALAALLSADTPAGAALHEIVTTCDSPGTDGTGGGHIGTAAATTQRMRAFSLLISAGAACEGGAVQLQQSGAGQHVVEYPPYFL
jgi:hypothetical protein